MHAILNMRRKYSVDKYNINSCVHLIYYMYYIFATPAHALHTLIATHLIVKYICDRILENGSKSHIFISLYLLQ